MEQPMVVGVPRRNRLSSQVILVLLLAALPLMSWLLFEQGRVIDAQRSLIHILNRDSQALNAIRMHEVQHRARQDAPSSKSSAEPSNNSADAQRTPAPERKRSKHAEPPKPPAPQEYPATRSIPARKAI